MLKAELTLASTSPTRRTILENAGLRVSVLPPPPDVEDAAKADYAGPAIGLAEHLARAKAHAVAKTKRGSVLGADQTLLMSGRLFHKPGTAAEAREQLAALQGATHELVSSLVLCKDGKESWAFTDSARLTVRALSSADIDDYVTAAADSVLKSVGGYQFEGVGIQLFDRIEGDYFTILGLPLLPLLRYLRTAN